MAKLKDWGIIAMADPEWNARRYDGRWGAQVRMCVRTTSQKAAAEATGCTLGYFRSMASETGNREELAALDMVPAGTVVIHGSLPGDTLFGGPEGFYTVDGTLLMETAQ